MKLKSIFLLIVSLTSNYIYCQTNQYSRIEFRRKKIKTILKTTFYSNKIGDKTIEHYDTLGNLIMEECTSDIPTLTDLLNYCQIYEYDKVGNVIAKYEKKKPKELIKKWAYEYNDLDSIIKKTVFDNPLYPTQFYSYCYDRRGCLLSDTVYDNGVPKIVTNYFYSRNKLVKSISFWVEKVKYPVIDRIKLSYNLKGLLIKEKSISNFSANDKLIDKDVNTYKYDKKNNLIEKKDYDETVRYLFDQNNNLIKKTITKRKWKLTKRNICVTLEYSFYD